MKLNLSLILNSIDCPHEYIKLDDSDPMRFIDSIPYLDNTYASQNILYIFRWNQLQIYSGDIDTVLCIGGGIDAVRFFQKRQYSGAVFSQDLDILALLCNLRIIFNHYNQLELELMELLSQEATTKALLNKCADIFCAHVSLYDSNMSLIEYSNLFAPSDEGLSELSKDVEDSITQKVSRDKVYMTPNIPGKFPVSSYVSNDKLHSRFIYGFDSGDTRFATMIVYQTISPLNKNLNWMVDHIGKLLTPKIKERYSFHINQRNRLRPASL